jgi:hypothetical protein
MIIQSKLQIYIPSAKYIVAIVVFSPVATTLYKVVDHFLKEDSVGVMFLLDLLVHCTTIYIEIMTKNPRLESLL